MSEPLDELYFKWLYSQVADSSIKNPSRTYWRMLKQLYTKEFVWIIPNDDNRIQDGKDLRYEFVDEQELENVDAGWMQLGCSMLEMLVALSRRLSFETDREPRAWFWNLMENIGFDGFNDRSKFSPEVVDEILDQIIWRTYKYDGRGGLFPLEDPSEDQRDVELWYQFNAYILQKV